MTYTTMDQYNELFPDEQITNEAEYAALEEIAVIYLKDVCGVFPSYVQFMILSEPYKGFLTKAILYEVNHIFKNKDFFFTTETEAVTSFSLGRFSVKEQTGSNAEVQNVSKLAAKFLNESGICDRSINAGCGCGCS